MKTYKLIKTYPGSPKLGTIALDIGFRYNYLDENRTCFDYTNSKKECIAIEDNPDFWEPLNVARFISTDGIEMYSGMKYYFVSNFAVFSSIVDEYTIFDKETKRFSTEKAANQYIINSYPLLSVKDVINILEYYAMGNVAEINIVNFQNKAKENLLKQQK